MTRLNATYIMPIRRDTPADAELVDYLAHLAGMMEVIVVDGSPPDVFATHGRMWDPSIRHMSPAITTLNGKVGGVVTGIRLARNDRLVIADDDVRYTPDALERLTSLLDGADIVRPQNYFDPLPWHARWDTARSLLNRVVGGDWPGTLGVRRSLLLRTNGYDGNVLFENLELVRTVKAAGGSEIVPLDLYVRRQPPSAEHFWSQRVRQAYDELARPPRFLLSLAVLPLVLGMAAFGQRRRLAVLASFLVAVAELGRRRAGGHAIFPVTGSLLAPAWVLERGICTWFALGARIVRGGVRYRGTVLPTAANSMRELRRRHGVGSQNQIRTSTSHGAVALVESL